MSQPANALPGDVKDLLVTTCGWEKFIKFDGHAEPVYAASVTKTCYRESHSMLQTGLEGTRQAEITWSDPDYDIYFDGDDPDARSFSLWDRFTFTPGAVGVAGPDVVNAITQQPTSIATVVGPWGSVPWLVVVAF